MRRHWPTHSAAALCTCKERHAVSLMQNLHAAVERNTDRQVFMASAFLHVAPVQHAPR